MQRQAQDNLPVLYLAAVFAGVMLYCSVTVAAPRAESAMECGVAADMAVVARSLAQEEVHRAKADTIMARIYDVSESHRGKQLMQEILDAAYSKKSGTSQKFAEDLFATCMKTGGNMEAVLGRKL
jgi:lipopolysaccharide export LptBFGC system permease protein LptF